MATIAEILKSRITKGSKSKTYIASELGVTEKTIENYINGKREPDATSLVKLSHLLGFSLNELSEQSVPPDPPKNSQQGKKQDPDPNPYIKLLEDNDRFFKTEYHNLLVSLNKIIEIGLRSEELIKLNLEHIGNVEAHLKEVEPDIVHEQINSQIAGMGAVVQKDIYAGK